MVVALSFVVCVGTSTIFMIEGKRYLTFLARLLCRPLSLSKNILTVQGPSREVTMGHPDSTMRSDSAPSVSAKCLYNSPRP